MRSSDRITCNSNIIAEKDSKRAKDDYIPVRDIVRNAIQNIPLNYPTNPHSYIGYYLE